MVLLGASKDVFPVLTGMNRIFLWRNVKPIRVPRTHGDEP